MDEDNKDQLRNRKSKKDRKYNVKKKGTKRQTMVGETIHRKVLSNMHPTKNLGVSSGAREDYRFPAPLVTPLCLLKLW